MKFRIYNRTTGYDWGVWDATDKHEALEQLAAMGDGVVCSRDDESVDWHRRIDPRDWLVILEEEEPEKH